MNKQMTKQQTVIQTGIHIVVVKERNKTPHLRKCLIEPRYSSIIEIEKMFKPLRRFLKIVKQRLREMCTESSSSSSSRFKSKYGKVPLHRTSLPISPRGKEDEAFPNRVDYENKTRLLGRFNKMTAAGGREV
jgi:hypothetical protein